MSRVRTPGQHARLHGYRTIPDLAFHGWRYRIPGGPEGGQYHGFIAPDSTQSWEGGQGGWPGGRSEIPEGPQKRPSGHSILPGQGTSKGPWAKEWGGTAFGEGQTHSDYVYRSPSEMRPRPNASGGQNVIFGSQDERTAGYAEAPGNYRSLGLVPLNAELMPAEPVYAGTYPLQLPPGPSTPLPPPKPAPVAYDPYPVYAGPGMWPVRYPYGAIPSSGYGATNTVAQPAPIPPAPQSLVPWTPIPVSPTPAPVVTAQPSDYQPSQGQVIDGLTPGTPSAPSAAPTDFSSWLAASTIIPGVANQWIALGGLAAFLMLNSGKGKR